MTQLERAMQDKCFYLDSSSGKDLCLCDPDQIEPCDKRFLVTCLGRDGGVREKVPILIQRIKDLEEANKQLVDVGWVIWFWDGHWHCYDCGDQVDSLGSGSIPICSDCYCKSYEQGGWE